VNFVSAQYTLNPVITTERKMLKTRLGVRVSSVASGEEAWGSAWSGLGVYVGFKRRW
jgi:hypothetical protein